MEYTFERHLGQGIFGSVSLVRHNGTQYALKKISKLHPKFHLESILQEKKIGELCNHPNICKLRKSYETEEHIYFFFDPIDGYDLITFMEERNFEPTTEHTSRAIFVQILRALQYLHERGIAHRDIKLDNVMMDYRGQVQLIDFGLSQSKNANRCCGAVGSFEYCAPEVFQPIYDGMKCDIWSTGVLLYALLCGQFPFAASQLQRMKRGIPCTPPFPSDTNLSKEAKDLLTRMLTLDPAKRISLSEVLSHPWVS